MFVPTLYSSRVSVAVINRLQQQEEDAGKTITDILIKSHNLAFHFAGLYASHEVAKQTLEVMGWTDTMTEKQLLRRISVDRTAGTLIINVTASYTDPAVAQQLATVYTDAMVDQLTVPLEINNVETVRGASEPKAYSYRLPVFLVCLAAAAILVFLTEYLNFKLNIRISSVKDVESYKLCIFGVIPTTDPIRQAPPAPGTKEESA